MDLENTKTGLWSARFLILSGVILILIVLLAYFFYGLQPSYAIDNPVNFKIEKGESFREIGAHLSQDSLVRSIAVFKAYAILTGSARKFQPGVYELASTMSVPQIVEYLTAGGKNNVTVRIGEGWTLKDIDAALASSSVIASGSLLNYPFRSMAQQYQFLADQTSLEGFLFPDTYNFELNSSPETILRSFLDAFELKAWPLLSNQKSWYGTLITASYLEREVPNSDDRRIVAGIIAKRLKMGMPLQIDATVSYGKCGGSFNGCDDPVVSKNDLKIDSPYNTYTRQNLTPTPIANPGKDALEAALSPRTSGYLYFISDPKTGKTIFAKTLDEQNSNRAKYL